MNGPTEYGYVVKELEGERYWGITMGGYTWGELEAAIVYRGLTRASRVASIVEGKPVPIQPAPVFQRGVGIVSPYTTNLRNFNLLWPTAQD
jgi:hypothetical protein